MPALLAAALVFVTSAAVLVLEILAGRLLAPYVGITLETYTAVIGTVLAGIAAGSWLGGFLADRVDPRRLLGPVVLGGGALAISAVPVVRALGDASVQDVGAESVLLAFAGFFLPAMVLSAVTPTVVKLQLRDLDHTGGVVGRLSGIGTAGALVGTFVTGFLLVAEAPTRAVIYGVGGFLCVVGLALWLWLSRQGPTVVACLIAATGVGTGLAAIADEPCDVESAYYCVRVTRDPLRNSGRVLWLDRDMHAYVDLADPAHLEWDYTQAFADVVALARPGNEAVDALHVGGGGFTMPRHFAATRPGSRNIVLELDPAVVDVARDRLGLRTSSRLRVRTGDGRVGIRRVPSGSVDVVVGDAFSDLSVPWHLTTREFVADVDRVLRHDGVYVMNVIDAPPHRFLAAELATLRERFEWVVTIADPGSLDTADNFVLAASHRRLPAAELDALVADQGNALIRDSRLERLVARAPVLTDDFAPVDQWFVGAER